MENDRTVVRIISGQRERIPYTELKIGDVVIDDKGTKVRIVTKSVRFWDLETNRRFRSPLHGGWFVAWIHGNAVFGLPVWDGPFGELRAKAEVIIPFPEQQASAIFFEPVGL